MHPYLASRLSRDREEEFRRRAELFRQLAEAGPTPPRWTEMLRASLRRAATAARLLRPGRLRFFRMGRPLRWAPNRPAAEHHGF